MHKRLVSIGLLAFALAPMSAMARVGNVEVHNSTDRCALITSLAIDNGRWTVKGTADLAPGSGRTFTVDSYSIKFKADVKANHVCASPVTYTNDSATFESPSRGYDRGSIRATLWGDAAGGFHFRWTR